MLATWISLFLRLLSKSSKEWMPLVSISVTAAIIWLLNYLNSIININHEKVDERISLKVLRDISTMRCCILGYSLDVLRISSSVSHFNIL